MGESVEVKLLELRGVREHQDGLGVELWRRSDGRVVVRCFNECGYSCTDLDLCDLLGWMKPEIIAGVLGEAV